VAAIVGPADLLRRRVDRSLGSDTTGAPAFPGLVWVQCGRLAIAGRSCDERQQRFAAGALFHELIDLAVILNALRALRG
jgi:hypothetical protein